MSFRSGCSAYSILQPAACISTDVLSDHCCLIPIASTVNNSCIVFNSPDGSKTHRNGSVVQAQFFFNTHTDLLLYNLPRVNRTAAVPFLLAVTFLLRIWIQQAPSPRVSASRRMLDETIDASSTQTSLLSGRPTTTTASGAPARNAELCAFACDSFLMVFLCCTMISSQGRIPREEAE